MKGCQIIWFRCTPSHTKQLTKASLLPLLLTPPLKMCRHKNACVHTLQKLKQRYWAGGATTVHRYQKNTSVEQLLEASQVGGVVTRPEPIVSPEVEVMRKHFLADYEQDVFSWEVGLCSGEEHPKGLAKLYLYANTKHKSVKPLRLVGEHAAAEQEIEEDFLARGWIEASPASEWASNGFVVPTKEKWKMCLVVDYRQLNEATLPDTHPLRLMEDMLESIQTPDFYYCRPG